MCGIVGYIGKGKAQEILVAGLQKLEYRGYDSAGIYVVDENRTILSANERTCEIFGYTKDEIVGQNFLIMTAGWNHLKNVG